VDIDERWSDFGRSCLILAKIEVTDLEDLCSTIRQLFSRFESVVASANAYEFASEWV